MSSQPDVQVNDETIRNVYEWVDTFNLSKPKKNISRDFSDGCLVAEIIHQHHPHLIELHNYYNTTNLKMKQSNWELLKRKAFKKMNFYPSDNLIEDVIECKYLAIETFLIHLQHITKNVEVQKPVIKVMARNAETNPDKGRSIEKKGSKNYDLKIPISQHNNELNEMKSLMASMKISIDGLQEQVKNKDKRIKALENRLFENGIRY